MRCSVKTRSVRRRKIDDTLQVDEATRAGIVWLAEDIFSGTSLKCNECAEWYLSQIGSRENMHTCVLDVSETIYGKSKYSNHLGGFLRS